MVGGLVNAGINLLIVEDQGYVLDTLDRILLKFPEFKVFRATDSETAKALIEEKCPDVLLQDIYVHGTSGLELLQLAKIKNPKVSAIIITGAGDADLGEKALKEGAWAYVMKPPELDKIETLLE